jgi:hypothetical protein
MSDNGNDSWVIVSYVTLRRIVGILGVTLPIVLVVGTILVTFNLAVRSSISAYYNSVMGPVFAGVLFVVGWFLYAYRGYDRRDDRAGDRACLFAMGVALFPHVSATHRWVPWVHYICAALLFLTLAYFSYFLFTLSDQKDPGPRKRKRNAIYRGCGIAIVVFIVLIGLYNLLGLDKTGLAALRPVLVLETLILWAFGLSWFVKGETLWRD